MVSEDDFSASDVVTATRPLPGMVNPTMISFSPCRKYLTYLASESKENLLSRQLYMVDVSDPSNPGKPSKVWDPASETTDSEESLSLEDKLRRERSRTMSIGITQYFWPSVSTRMLIPLSGNLFCKEEAMFGDESAIRKVFDKDVAPEGDDDATGGALDPTLSPDGKFVAFVRDAELYVLSLEDASATPVRVTFDARGTGRTNGLADYLAQEEMDRYKGFWWSQDSSMIAFEQVDESHIPKYRIMHQGSDLVGDQAQEDHRYPFAGGPNPKVKLGIVDIMPILDGSKSQVRWLDTDMELGKPKDNYVGRVEWLPDGSLSAQLENREQTELILVRYDPVSLERTEMVRETSDVWINLNHLFVPFESRTAEKALGISSPGLMFLWGSERTGFQHLYLYFFDKSSKKTSLVKQVTNGDWMVTSLAQMSPGDGSLFFHATKKDATERHLYHCNLWDSDDSTTVTQVTNIHGTNQVVIDSKCSMAVVNHSSIDAPPSTNFCELKMGKAPKLVSVKEIFNAESSPLTAELLEELAPAFKSLEIVRFPSSDEAVELVGVLQLPDPKKFGPGPYPLVVPVYGGPHVQRVLDTWSTTADMRATRLASVGFAVLKVDNRGSSGRGLAFEGAIKNCMGTVEVEDQVAGVEYLVSKGLVDPRRVGMYGWSYGGYMSLMCLFQRPDVFKVAVSGAPVTNWDGYDTHYTERYMGTPQSNPQGYHDGSVMTHVPTFSKDSHLMLIHGLIDENVHFRHTARLVNALIQARKKYDLLLFPDERHSPRKLDDRVYMEERIREYFCEHLLEPYP